MKRIIYASFLLVLAIVGIINNTNFNNAQIIPVNLNVENTNQEYIEIHFETLKSVDIIKTFEGLDIDIIEITPKKFSNVEYVYKVTEENIKQMVINLINDYKKTLIINGFHEEAVIYEQKGFLIESMKVKCTIDQLNILKSKTKIII